ncbi:peptidylprolyl isomerase [Pelagerythrobacter marensis]|uniref:peptidylprolyl isomerase n=1 Tax=Pelagerythrobacter marensis TaxID=543877 RepID=A0ABZ2CZQ4_9SPHN
MFTRFALLAAPFALAAAASAQDDPAPAPPPAPAGTHETALVVIETELGDITARIETERAPVTAANFLRYVDEGRFDGTVFYRAMPLEWGEQPNGLIQAGTQHDPERVLPPIAHEPTSETGVTHVRGALSMARNAPGTATGDFSIVLQEQPGMDADPASDDPELRAGYAAFGRVVEGMDVVEAIHAAPTDPDAGEGWMKGQMLDPPIEIVKIRRVPADES